MGIYDKKPIVIWDIDGTLANIDHRRAWVDGSKGYKDFDKFYDLMVEDPPYIDMVGMCNMQHLNTWTIFFCTGRPESYRQQTEQWLKDHGVLAALKDINLLMRPDKLRYKPDFVIKEQMMNDLHEAGYEIHMVWEDRDQACKMWRSHGLRCVQVAPGNF